MNLAQVKSEVFLKTQLKIQEITARNIIVPKRLADRCELCDQLSVEIYDCAVSTLLETIDRYHLHHSLDALLNSLHEDFCKLSGSAAEILLVNQPQVMNGGITKENERFENKNNYYSYMKRGICLLFLNLKSLVRKLLPWIAMK